MDAQERTKKKRKIIFMVLLNTLPFWLCCMMFPIGALTGLICLMLHLTLTYYNFMETKKLHAFLLLNGVLLVATAAGLTMMTWLYYHFVSSDAETPIAGMAVAYVMSIFVLGLTVFVAFFRVIRIIYEKIKGKTKDSENPECDLEE